ncbi:MAG: LPXTG cell wall anchor domain-containing protein [Lachnospiraceae bacterium]|nr:LPXTG cell wall anchor domain-containing protein [Lachnospiraceae bacterium]
MKYGKSLLDKAVRSIRKLNRFRTLIVTLSAIVVFVISYLLILPALTLDEKEAEKQGGIDIVTQASGTDGQEEAGGGTTQSASTETDKKTEQTQKAPTYKDGELSYAGKSFDVEAKYEKKANIPESTELKVEEINQKDDQYTDYYKKAVEAVEENTKDGTNKEINAVRFYDISLIADGTEIEPADPVNVTITYDAGVAAKDADHVRILHFVENQETGKITTEVLEEDKVDATVRYNKLSKASFEAESFSVYGIVTLQSDPDNPADPLGLDGKSYGILNNQNTVSGTALMTGSTSVSGKSALKGQSMTVRTEPINRTGIVFVASNSQINMWTFHSAGNGQYYITTVVSGTLKYIKISNTGLSLVDEADADCRISITAGTGKYEGKYKFTSSTGTLRLNGSNFVFAGENVSNNANDWMNFAELSTLNDDDFVTYTATKVSVSDTTNVPDGAQVIIYTRIWNEETLKYEYYTIDYDGMLVRAYESGDTISWVGTKINTMLWDFTEYHNADGTLNYYYEFQNDYSGKYIAPQISGTDFLSDNTIGVNLNGRRYGEYYTSIVAWDDPYYDYASLKAKDGKLISVPISKADDFYFAVMKPVETSDNKPKVVETIDHKPFGITLKMQDYENINSSNRSQDQVNVLGNTPYNQWTGSPGLLEKNLTGDYPKVKNSTHSLSELYNNTLEVNQQFLLTTFEETGYFEYDSTQNFAHLITSTSDYWYGKEKPTGGTYKIGDFVIYDQLGTSSEKNKDTLKHGQFLPYNDLVDSNGNLINVSKQYTNERDIHAEPLSSLDPRKGEALYEIPHKSGQTAPDYVDHFFGMEMTASFIQSESGLDDWGHDLIFEFSGDDDFWLYVDGMLVMDLGGIHSALDGSINFRTGKVIVNKKETNLRTLYHDAYKEAHPSATEADINAWLNTIFEDNGSNTGTVFKDYTGHTMRMFYMERGAGASNLHMRFNLAPYTNGEVQLEKEVSGTDSIQYTDASFPFQIWYKDTERPDQAYVLLTDQTKVKDTQTGQQVTYQESYSVGGRTYQNVFFLKPDQTVSIRLPSEDTEYYIKECALDKNTYDAVHINRSDTALAPTSDTADSDYKDYQIVDSTVVNRKKVIFDNHVTTSALKSLTIKKKLWMDEEKTTPQHNDTTTFRFRVYIGKTNGSYSVYSFGKYHVKNAAGEYCIYKNGGFQTTHKTRFSDLSTEVGEGELKSEQEQATFYTSQGGAVDKIPVDYSVEIPDLMNGTPFFVEERASEIPAGYQLIDYELTGGEYTVDESLGDTKNYGLIKTNKDDPVVIVNNQHGYGLTVQKKWSDAPFMASHDDIYVGIFLKGGTDGNTLTLLEDSVRRLRSPNTTYTWFFEELVEGKSLEDYVVYELKLEGSSISVDDTTGIVSGWDSLTRIEENGSLTVGGVSGEHGYSQDYVYTVNYLRGGITANGNAKTDFVVNSRPGIKLVKTDMNGNALKGAVFTLTKADGNEDGDTAETEFNKTFTSDEEGLIAVAYLEQGKEYVLTEQSSPDRYQALLESVTIRVEVEDGKYVVYVNGSPEDDNNDPVRYTIAQVDEPTASVMPTITIKNRPFTVNAKKIDAYTGYALEGVKFAVYAQKKDYYTGDLIPDYTPMAGFENLLTDADGIIPKIDAEHLKPGTYYLREEEALYGYKAIGGDIRFKISDKGLLTIEDAPNEAAVLSSEEVEGVMNYTLLVKDTPNKSIQILKKTDNTEEPLLAGVAFELYKVGQIDEATEQPKEGEVPKLTGTTDENGVLKLGVLEEDITYYLFETDIPKDGYVKLDKPVKITVTGSKVTAKYDDQTLDARKISGTNEAEIWEISVVNHLGYELPMTGGVGTRLIYLLGALMVAFAAAASFIRRRRREAL